MSRGNWIWIVLAAGGLIALVMLLADRFPGKLDDVEDGSRLFYLVAILVLVVSGGSLAHFRARPRSGLAQLGVWIAIFAVLMLGYSFKSEFGQLGARLTGAMMPSSGEIGGPGEISFPLSDDGHFHVMASINGQRVDFLVDSGASDIVLSPEDARRIGYDPSQLSFTSMVETANGSVFGAPIRLGEIAVGPIAMLDIPAQVNRAEMSSSLLGMEFLNRLQSWHVENDRLTLRK